MAAGLFKVPNRPGRAQTVAAAKKAAAPAKKAPTTTKGGGGLMELINVIRATVEKNLGYLRDKYILIQTEEDLISYIDAIIEGGAFAIDTETTGLDPLQDQLAGICIYAPGQKGAYIPVHHKSYVTGEEVAGQLPVTFLHDQFQRVVDAGVFTVMFNAAFDIRVMRSGVGVRMKCDWDCYLAARLLNENEGPGNNGLKALHNKYCLDGQGDAFKFDDLFKGITFDYVPIKTGYLYAAHDPEITWELYEFQRPFLTPDDPECIEHGLVDVAWVFHNIEMPCVAVVADMEDTGVQFDMDYDAVLHEKYTKLAEAAQAKVYAAINMYSVEIEQYKAKHPGHKLGDPINVDSVQQLATLLYDIMGCESPDPKTPRGTGEDILKGIGNDVCTSVLEYRGVTKLLSTYIDKLPRCVNPKDGRVHCKFNQYGADTGRFSSQDPNLQNIPSHNHEIRQMFTATVEYGVSEADDDMFSVSEYVEVETPAGFVKSTDVKVGDKLLTDAGPVVVNSIIQPVDNNHTVCYYVHEAM